MCQVSMKSVEELRSVGLILSSRYTELRDRVNTGSVVRVILYIENHL